MQRSRSIFQSVARHDGLNRLGGVNVVHALPCRPDIFPGLDLLLRIREIHLVLALQIVRVEPRGHDALAQIISFGTGEYFGQHQLTNVTSIPNFGRV